MSPIEWLEQKAPGFVHLSPDERNAIMHFALMWSFFEDQVLGNNASAAAIETAVADLDRQGRLQPKEFDLVLAYFRNRYFKVGSPTPFFSDLNVRKNDNPPLVTAVLSGANNQPSDCVSATLIVVYRLRNNLFHGTKWAYGIAGQLDNFTAATQALMTMLDQHGVAP